MSFIIYLKILSIINSTMEAKFINLQRLIKLYISSSWIAIIKGRRILNAAYRFINNKRYGANFRITEPLRILSCTQIFVSLKMFTP